MTGFRYSSRPAKHVVRILLAEACRRITPIAEPATYRYVGLGGLEFTDFVVFRKTLGITRMVSIERDTHRFARYEFNKPFGGIELLGGTENRADPLLVPGQIEHSVPSREGIVT